MIITKQKNIEKIKENLGIAKKIFLFGCGECSTTCKTGGEDEIKAAIAFFEKDGKVVLGYDIPKAPCVSSQSKISIAKNRRKIEEADAVVVFTCGLGTQTIKENLRIAKNVYPACDTLFMGATDSKGNFKEMCSACGECILELTGTICPVTLCAKGLLNGPCGGVDKGKCEVDSQRDCAWVLIYDNLKKEGKLDLLKNIQKPKDRSKENRPRNRQ